MPWTKERLQAQFHLADEDVLKTLKVCNLPVEQDEYTDEEIETLFKVVRSYFDSHRTDTYTGAADLFAQEHGASAVAQEELDVNHDGLLSFSELLSLASEQCQTRITFKEVAAILDSCGLPDKDQYTSVEGDRFMTACELIKQQGKSYKEVAAHFGLESATPTQQPKQLQQLLEELGELTVLNESVVVDLVDKVTGKRSELLEGIVQQSYLKNALLRFKKDQANAKMVVAELEQRVLDYIEGKSPAQSLQAIWGWEKNSLPSSSPKPMSLPEGSDNGTNAS